jgi:hypothetical protein
LSFGISVDVKAAKDPDSVKDYSVDWTDWLAPVNDEIVSSEFFTDDDTLTIVSGDGHDGVRTVVWLSGGLAGTKYKVTNRITTASSPIARVEDRTMIIPVRDL